MRSLCPTPTEVCQGRTHDFTELASSVAVTTTTASRVGVEPLLLLMARVAKHSSLYESVSSHSQLQ